MQSQTLTLTTKEELAPQVYLLTFKLAEPISYFPGQYTVLQIDPKTFRSYSIVEVTDTTLTLLIDVQIGGPASQFFIASKEGTELNLIGKPLGRFVVHDTGSPKVFVATGTGIAPFVPMVKAVLQQNENEHVKVYFGARHVKHDYSGQLFEDCTQYPNFELIRCISQPEVELGEGFFEGRVTKIVPEHFEDCRTQEFYLCGNPQMVDDIQEVLLKNGAHENLFTEKYG